MLVSMLISMISYPIGTGQWYLANVILVMVESVPSNFNTVMLWWAAWIHVTSKLNTSNEGACRQDLARQPPLLLCWPSKSGM